MKVVTAICPTRNRRKFLPGAIADFLAQDYPAKELVILDDGDDWVWDLVPDDSRVQYWRRLHDQPTIGTKRNALCELAKGQIICHWDDDDIYGPRRISEQVKALEETGAEVTGYQDLLFREESGRLWMYSDDSGAYVVGVSLCYLKQFWKTHRFREDLAFSEDNAFVDAIPPGGLAIRNSNQIIARIHSGNTCPRGEAQFKIREHWREIA